MQVNDPCSGTCLSMNEQLSCEYITPRPQAAQTMWTLQFYGNI